MKICFISEYFTPTYGGQYLSKGIIDMCKLKKIEFIIFINTAKVIPVIKFRKIN